MKIILLKRVMNKLVSWMTVSVLIVSGCSKDEPTGPDTTPPTPATGTFTQVAVLQGPADAVASIAISPDGRTFAYGTFADNLIRVVDVATRQVTRTLSGHTNRVTELTFSPNSQTLASSGTVNLPPNIDGSVRMWDVAGGAQLASVTTSGVSQLAFAPNGSLLAGASGGDPLRIQIWNVTTLALQRSISNVFRVVAFSPDGNRIATAARNDSVYILDFSTGARLVTYGGHTGWVTAVAYNTNGQVLATAADDRTIRLWNTQTGQVSKTLSGHTTYPDFVAFSPDGTTLASVGSGINITRTSSGISVSISNADRFLRQWDLSTGAEIPRLDVAGDVVTGVAFSADWKLLVTASSTGMVRIFQRGG